MTWKAVGRGAAGFSSVLLACGYVFYEGRGALSSVDGAIPPEFQRGGKTSGSTTRTVMYDVSGRPPASEPETGVAFGGGTNVALNKSCFSNVAKNLSYSIANPYPETAGRAVGYRWTNTQDADFALMADVNPGTGSAGEKVQAVAGPG